MKCKNRFLALCLSAALLAGCTAAPASVQETPPPAAAPSAAPEATPAATEAAPSAAPLLSPEDTLTLDGSTACMPLMANVYAAAYGLSLEDAETRVTSSRTDNAWNNLVSDKADLLLVYEPSEGAQAALDAGEVQLERTAIGRDALVFLKNSQNTVTSLTQDELRGIYTGAVTNWKELGGPDTEIAPFQRNTDSGSQTMFLKLLMQGQTPMDPPTELVSGGMDSLLESVAGYDNGPGAIGYSVYYYAAKMMATPGIALLDVDGVAATDASIADGSYPFTNDFYAAIRADAPEDSPARILYNWLQTDAGKLMISGAGYVAAE